MIRAASSDEVVEASRKSVKIVLFQLNGCFGLRKPDFQAGERQRRADSDFRQHFSLQRRMQRHFAGRISDASSHRMRPREANVCLA